MTNTFGRKKEKDIRLGFKAHTPAKDYVIFDGTVAEFLDLYEAVDID